MDSGDLHRLMTALEVPAIAFLGLAGIDVDKRIPLRTPLPVALATHTMRRLAFEVDNNFGFFHTAFHGDGVSLAIELHANCFASLVERKQWAFTEFLTMLSLSNIEELHIQVCNWEAHQEILLHLAAHMPAVSTLLIRVKHPPSDPEKREGGRPLPYGAGANSRPRPGERQSGALSEPRPSRSHRSHSRPAGVFRARRRRTGAPRPGRPAVAQAARRDRRVPVPAAPTVCVAQLQADGHTRPRRFCR